ncbi:CLUMA_CG013417, isoform A [Clunio marinus]|uniref:CLUMA_CG013417, isoform A n=1 Tax=Clunio marinus TaxID=568069 RepID=A0A1J1IKS0_9DIPT|nr:CLUMA_CG013417, isoform A [Clunio marinus]
MQADLDKKRLALLWRNLGSTSARSFGGRDTSTSAKKKEEVILPRSVGKINPSMVRALSKG